MRNFAVSTGNIPHQIKHVSSIQGFENTAVVSDNNLHNPNISSDSKTFIPPSLIRYDACLEEKNNTKPTCGTQTIGNLSHTKNLQTYANSKNLSEAMEIFTSKIMNNLPLDGNPTIMPMVMLMQSLYLALSTKGKTQQELSSLLGINNGDLQESLTKLLENSNISNLLSSLQKNIKFASSFWTHSDTTTKEASEILDALQKNGIPLELHTFKDNDNYHIRGDNDTPTKSLDELVNAWASKKTKGEISHILDKKDVTLARFIAASYSELNAKWEYKFNQCEQKKPFAEIGDVSMMELKKTKLSHMQGENFTGFSLPYNSSGLNAAIFLPNEGVSVDDLYKQLASIDKNHTETYQSNLTNHLIAFSQPQRPHMWQDTPIGVAEFGKKNITMPDFISESEINTKDVMQKIGIQTPFGENADFSRISNEDDLYLSVMKDKVKVKFDKDGTKAVGVGVAVVATRGLAPITDINVNRPFIYVVYKEQELYSEQRPLPLVVGIMRDPTKVK